MPSINIKTRLGNSCCKHIGRVRKYITRGATAVFDIDLSTKVYTFEDLYQFTFMFKQGDTVWKFDTFEENDQGEVEIGEYIKVSDDHTHITLTLPPSVTVDFEKTGFEDGDEYNLIIYETIIQLEIGEGYPDATDPVLIERHPLIAVKDSLYAYFEDRTICGEIDELTGECITCDDGRYVKN